MGGDWSNGCLEVPELTFIFVRISRIIQKFAIRDRNLGHIIAPHKSPDT